MVHHHPDTLKTTTQRPIEVHEGMLAPGVTAEEAPDGWLVRFSYDPSWNRIAQAHDAVWQRDRKAWLIGDPRPMLNAFRCSDLNIELGRAIIRAGGAAREFLWCL